MAKTRVYELAKELGIDSKTLLDHLKSMGHYVKSASSPLESPLVREVCSKFPGYPPAASPPTPAAARPIWPASTPKTRPRVAPRPEPADWHTAWFSEFFEPSDADAWVEAGIGKHEVAKAAYLGSHGVTPEVYARYSTDLHGRRTSELVDGEHTVLWLVEQIDAADRAQRARERANAQRWQESQELRRALD